MNRRGFLASAIAAILAPPLVSTEPAVDVFTLEHLHALKRQLKADHVDAEEYVAFLPSLWTGRIGRYEGVTIYDQGSYKP